MDKLKNVFRPGGSKDDEVLYGSGSSSAAQGSSEPAQLTTDPAAEKKDHSILRQLLNPGGDKYDEMRYGTTAHADKPLDIKTTGSEPQPLPDHIESTEAAEDNSTVTRQIFNPGGEKYDEQRYGETAQAAPGTTPSRPSFTDDGGSTIGIRKGVLGSQSDDADSTVISGSEPINTTAPSELERDAAVGGAAATGLEASETHRSERAFPLGGGATSSNTQTAPETGNLASGSAIADRTRQSGYSEPPTTVRETARQEVGSDETSHLGRDAGIAGGVGAGALGAGALASHERESHATADPTSTSGVAGSGVPETGGFGLGDGRAGVSGAAEQTSHFHHDLHGPTHGHHDDETPVEGYVHHTRGPHALDMANILDPHVPGEFPTESGEDPHAHAATGTGVGLGTADVGAAGYETAKSTEAPLATSSSNQSGPIMTTTNQHMSASEPERHYGRDAAVAGGVGAAGVGAYEATRDRSENIPPTATSSLPEPSQSSTLAKTEQHIQNEPPQSQEQHYGRDAALAGGAGAAGIGAYEVGKDRSDTGPASSTIGPHDSNLANIVDPRVKPEPEKMKPQQTTSAPVQQEQHHYGSDAAVAGGAGAAGVGAYEATKDRPAEATTTTAEQADPTAAAREYHHPHHEHNKLHKKNDPRGHHQDEKHERDLQKARDEVAAKGGDHGSEKKPSLISRILHPHGKHEDDSSATSSASAAAAATHPSQSEYTGPHQRMGVDGPIGDPEHVSGNVHAQPGDEGVVIEPHTGLPMNVGKYGTGHGGTDGSSNIEGYHAGGEGAATTATPTDLEAIRKANTPY